MKSEDNEVLPSDNVIQYGPLKIRRCRKPAPTIATGRRSKFLILFGDEEIKREQRRTKNREAARKLKEKRQLIEEQLDEKLRQLEYEHLVLQEYLQRLEQKKQNLEQKIDSVSTDPLIELLSKNNQNMLLFFEECSDDLDFFGESLDKIFDSEL
ncbi:unnamed protein product [Adineta steineri]|uniref:BZIP domain-containing protein n=1 Tax=Adineta steineri TaxID=433720 RepID=A0A819Q5J7_9BILA|nr:unnamed protein product [Adineta steineri]CAF4024962.1 unnamed protein product [Adineta steineri]